MAKVPLFRFGCIFPTGDQQNAREEDLLAPHWLFIQVLESIRHFHHQLYRGITAVNSALSIFLGVSLQLTCGVEKLSVRGPFVF
jgi:hypothetical protein